MKKITAVILSLLLILPSLMIMTTVSAADTEAPKLVYEPVTATVKAGKSATLTTVAQGKNLRIKWVLTTMESGYDETFDLGKSEGIKKFEALDGSGKMKVKVTYVDIGDDQIRSTVTIENIIYFNYCVVSSCTVSNGAGTKECDPAYVYTNDSAPPQADVKVLAEFSVRNHKLVKLYANVQPPAGAGYVDDDIMYSWYVTPDGDKMNAVYLDYEDYPILMADGYTSGAGTYYFFCVIFIKYGTSYYHYETGVTEMTVYDPKISVSYDAAELSVYDGQTASITATATVEPEKDKETLSYQWYSGDSPTNINTKLSGETSPVLTLTGGANSITRYYRCVVNDHTSDDFDFNNASDTKTCVKVVFKGFKRVVITEQPKNAEVTEGETATFTVKAENAKHYNWLVYDSEKNDIHPVNDSPDSVSGSNTDTLVIVGTEELNGKMFFCNITDQGGIYTESALAKLTVKPREYAETPALDGSVEEITAHVGDGVKLTVKASVTDGGMLSYKWYASENDPRNAEDILHAPGAGITEITDAADLPEYAPDNTKEGSFYYICSVVNKAEGKEDSAEAIKIFVIGFTQKEDVSADQTSEHVTSPGTDGSETGSSSNIIVTVLILLLTAFVALLAMILVLIGIIVLIKYRKKK